MYLLHGAGGQMTTRGSGHRETESMSDDVEAGNVQLDREKTNAGDCSFYSRVKAQMYSFV